MSRGFSQVVDGQVTFHFRRVRVLDLVLSAHLPIEDLDVVTRVLGARSAASP